MLRAATTIALFIGSGLASSPTPIASLPAPPKHIVAIFEENRDLGRVEFGPGMPVLHSFIQRGALFTDAHGVSHPSLPNYFAIFAGKENTDGDACSDKPVDAFGDLPVNSGLSAAMPTLASELIAAKRTFVGYAESLPRPGYVGCFGRGGSFFSPYYKRHAPWAFFTKAGHPGAVAGDTHHYLLDDALNQPFSAFPAAGHYDDLPTVAMVTPNASDDMHGTPLGKDARTLEADADAWLGRNIAPLVEWAMDPKNATLVIITWDEGAHHREHDANQIPTLFLGSMVRPGPDAEHITHYDVLATIERFYGLAPMSANDANARVITGCWK